MASWKCGKCGTVVRGDKRRPPQCAGCHRMIDMEMIAIERPKLKPFCILRPRVLGPTGAVKRKL